MAQGWDDFRRALAFLTVLPVGRTLPWQPQRLAPSMALFPAVGLALGLGLVVVNGVLSPLLPRPVVDALLLLALIVVSGGLHLDGLADLVDGLAGGKDRADSLRIMKDSRVGAMGVIALVMVLLLKYLALTNVPAELKSAALILLPTAGRWIQVALATGCPYARPEGGTGQTFVDAVGRRELLFASLTLALAALVLCGLKGLALLALLGGAALLLRHYFNARLGGVTGDVLGAATEIVEVWLLLLVLALY